ncbi:brassinosteroid-related acyltransferase 1 [Coffea eugenioides]|uniref:Brassinosteroid-related acyltransferase 1-like n=1 Tax=Coffea arabica TaxID=13443 RepID=A0A6P6VB16_COFAR|nr:brassinosteroid-related acyltransferase 1-like [Coffea arabica]XP_027184293.1 brassinosteroid-related acyltransferase 1 [Coffea eugenioides]
MELHVSLKETITLRPSEEVARQTIELSGLDRISPAILYTILFFKSSSTEKSSHLADEVFERAKKSLAKMLVSWFPAAGRFKINEATGKLEIDCNNEGVIMVTAETDSTLDELGKLYEYKPSYEKLVPQLPHADGISKNPLVVVQITSFACGGFSVGFGSSHALFDGAGAFNFLASWAHISCGRDVSESSLPNHSRDALLKTVYTNNSFPPSTSISEQKHIVAIQDLCNIPMQGMASDDRCWEAALSKFTQFDPKDGLQLMTLSITKEFVESLKRLAVERGKLTRCSTFDALCALIWKARVKALGLRPDANICLQFPVDSRARFQPPLGENFTGNAFVLASVSCMVKTILEESLDETVLKIQEAKDAIKDEYIKLYATALESSDKFFPSMKELTIVTDWMKYSFDALVFGWGQVSSVALLATPVPETAFLMLNLEEPGGFLLRMGIGEEEAPNFVDFFYNFSQ